MSTAAVVSKALYTLYTSLTFSGKPTLWPDGAPFKDANSDPVNPPYAEMFTEGDGNTEYTAGLHRMESVPVTVAVYALTHGTLKAIVSGICYNGQTPLTRAGFDDALTLTLPTGYRLNKVERTKTGPVVEIPPRSVDGEDILKCTLTYVVEVWYDPSL